MDLHIERRALALFQEFTNSGVVDTESWVTDRAGENPDLKQRFLQLVDASKSENSILEQQPYVGPRRPSRIDKYVIVKELGRGGMGTVYLGERADGEFTQQVAIKVVRNRANQLELEDRFQQERQILANLRHPNIAQLFDGGRTSDGSTFLVMEFVEGSSLDQYMQDNPDLTLKETLRLFQKICDAVQAAHEALIIHRDLKPGNVLVAHSGEPKLLDFGIAKLLEEQPGTQPVTKTSAAPMTLWYASPEQVQRVSLTTASDVHGLGLMLFELLAGVRPYELSDLPLSEVEQVIREQIPSRVSDVTVRFVGEINRDLDLIVAKALHKDPTRRYGNANALAEDLERFLAGLPVTAVPDSPAYRASRFARRHRFGVGAAAALLLALVAGFGTSVWQAKIARDQARIASENRAVAEREQRKAVEINQFLKDILLSPNPYNDSATGITSDVTMKAVIESAGERLSESFSEQPDIRADLYTTLGRAAVGLSQYDLARDLHRHAIDLLKNLDDGDPKQVIDAYYYHAFSLLKSGQLESATASLLRAREIAMNALPADSEVLSWILNDLAVSFAYQGNYATAVRYNAESIETSRARLGDKPNAVLASTVSNHGAMLALAGDLKKSRTTLQEALAMYAALQDDGHVETGSTYGWIAKIERLEGHSDAALVHAKKAAEIAANFLGRNHVDYEGFVPELPRNLIELGQLDEAADAISHTRFLLTEYAPDAHNRLVVQFFLEGYLAHHRGEISNAIDLYRQADTEASLVFDQYAEMNAEIDLVLGSALMGSSPIEANERLARGRAYFARRYGPDLGYADALVDRLMQVP